MSNLWISGFVYPEFRLTISYGTLHSFSIQDVAKCLKFKTIIAKYIFSFRPKHSNNWWQSFDSIDCRHVWLFKFLLLFVDAGFLTRQIFPCYLNFICQITFLANFGKKWQICDDFSKICFLCTLMSDNHKSVKDFQKNVTSLPPSKMSEKRHLPDFKAKLMFSLQICIFSSKTSVFNTNWQVLELSKIRFTKL